VLDLYRSWHSPILTRLQSRLGGVLHDLEDAVSPATSLVGRPLKTRSAIVAKLVREKSRLARIQDIAGTRIVVPTLAEQDAVLTAALAQFGSDASVVKDTRKDGDALGYRALHVVVQMDGRLAEIQIRTATQASWAQIVEILDEQGKTDLKHGNGPAETLEWLRQASDALRRVDLGEAKLSDALVALGLGGIVSLMQNRKAE
jgi:ppGpp synthetase/RelA/SpoT-type nucleotidyltranferase